VYRRQVAAMVMAFLSRIETGRHALEQWVGAERPLWVEPWGPWGDRVPGESGRAVREKSDTDLEGGRARSQDIEDPQGGGALASVLVPGVPEGGKLLRGPAFCKRIVELTRDGITQLGARHDAVLKMTWYLGVTLGLREGEVEGRLRQWLTGHDHVSRLSGARFVRVSLRDGMDYYRRVVVRCAPPSVRRCQIDLALRPLAAVDGELVDEHFEPGAERDAARAILGYLAGRADGRGVVTRPVDLSSATLARLCGDRRLRVPDAAGTVRRRRAVTVVLERLEALGMLSVQCDYSTGHHGRRWSCWYRFGSGQLGAVADAPADDASDGRRVLAERDVEEGRLRLVSPAQPLAPPTLELTVSEATAPELAPCGDRGAWWVRMYRDRTFTVGEFVDADPDTLTAGPQSRLSRIKTPVVIRRVERPGSASSASQSRLGARTRARVPSPERRLPFAIANANTAASNSSAGGAGSLPATSAPSSGASARPPEALELLDQVVDPELRATMAQTWRLFVERGPPNVS